MDTNELLLAYHVRELAMKLLANRAPKGLSTEQLYQFQRDNYGTMVSQVVSDLEYTAALVASERKS